jgi:hypothetical protein
MKKSYRQMIATFIKLFALLFFFLLLLPAQVALADTGPKPTMAFVFQQELPAPAGQVTITSGTLYECEQSDCRDAAPLEAMGPQRFTCESTTCYAMAYGFSPYHRLEIHFSDGQTRQSNVFETAGFDSRYTVTVRPDDLLVEAQFSLGIFPRTGTILVACLCGLTGIGLLAGLAILMRRRFAKT